MKHAPIICAAILWLASGAAGEIAATLSVADPQDEGAFPYRSADLALENSAGRSVETVLLRPVGGGPAVRVDFAVPPGATGRTTVPLPALSLVQEYALAARDASGADVGSASAAITWPADLLTKDAFVDAAYAQWEDARASWPRRARRNGLLLLAALAASAAAALFVPHRLLRAVVVASVAAISLLVGAYLLDGSGVLRARQYHLVRYRPGQPAQVESFAVLAARRTTRRPWQAKTLPYPVYPDDAASVGDDAEVDVAEKTITLTFRPGAVRVIRPASRKMPIPAATPSGTARSDGDRTIVQADFPHQRAVLVRDESVWPIPPGFGRLSQSVTRDQARSIWTVTSNPAAWRLESNDARLFSYWRNRHRQAGKTYLVNFAGGIDDFRMEVLELRSPDKPAGPEPPGGGGEPRQG